MILGLDIGYRYTKFTTDGRNVIAFPSSVTRAWGSVDDSWLGSSKGWDNVSIQYNGESWNVGERAEQEDPNASAVLNADRTKHDSLAVLVATTILSLPKVNNGLHVVAGLPYGATEDDKKAFQVFLQSFHGPITGESGIVKEKRWNDRIDLVHLFKQAAGAFLDSALDITGKPKRSELLMEHAREAIIDVGYKTTDVAVCELNPRLKVITSLSFTIPIGVSNVEERLQKEFQKKFGTTLDAQRMRMVLEDKKIMHFGEIVELTGERKRDVEDVGGRICDQIRLRWGEGIQTVGHVSPCGGGGQLLLEPLKQLHPKLELITDPQGANDRGFWKWGFFARAKGGVAR